MSADQASEIKRRQQADIVRGIDTDAKNAAAKAQQERQSAEAARDAAKRLDREAERLEVKAMTLSRTADWMVSEFGLEAAMVTKP